MGKGDADGAIIDAHEHLNQNLVHFVGEIKSGPHHDDGFLDLHSSEQEGGETVASHSKRKRSAFETITDATSSKDRGQVAQIFDLQFRTHLWSFYFEATTGFARLLRWDRSGCIVSERFDARTANSPLARFFFRLGRMTPAEMGFDDSVKCIKKDDLDEEAKEALRALEYWKTVEYRVHKSEEGLRDDQRLALEHPLSAQDVLRIEVPDLITCLGDEDDFQDELPPGHLPRRGTVGFPVYDPKDKRVYFLKDSWRALNLPAEWGILKALQSAPLHPDGASLPPPPLCSSPYIPSVVFDGVLPTQGRSKKGDPHRTLTADFALAPWNKNKGRGGHLNLPDLDARVHQRFCLAEVCHPLSRFGTTKELTTAVCDAIEGHQHAYQKGYLHRDISYGNVMFVRRCSATRELSWCGLLLDWDMALTLDDVNARHNERMGTAPYVSIKQLTFTPIPRRPHNVSDDLESFYWLLLFVALRWCRWNQGPCGLERILEAVFNDSEAQDYISAGGHVHRTVNGGKYKTQIAGHGFRRYVLTGRELVVGMNQNEGICQPNQVSTLGLAHKHKHNSPLGRWLTARTDDLDKLLRVNYVLQDNFFLNSRADPFGLLEDLRQAQACPNDNRLDAFAEGLRGENSEEAKRMLWLYADAVDADNEAFGTLVFGSHQLLISSLRNLLSQTDWPTDDGADDGLRREPSAEPWARAKKQRRI
ncbi:hypothetical protein V5O48_015921 [Marasmius crinis-equi]|uniref:Fungal-type protein kinase domain-containing protein n=1 Tax=Marasmius crinis-equi TaxID=585013 RepID=A0ABR3ETB2_9AGAR